MGRDLPGPGGVERRRGDTQFLPHEIAAGTGASRTEWTLPPHLQDQLPRRLRMIALLYSGAYFFADLFPALLMPDMAERPSFAEWLPTLASIAAGLVVALVAASRRIAWRPLMHLGLAFEVLGSYGIALSMYHGAERFAATPEIFLALTPSWVGIWMIVYSIIVPAPPGRALIALLASSSAPPLLLGLALQRAGLLHLFTPGGFFIHFIFPYFICAGLAYAGARILFTMGADVSRARELGSYRLIERLGQGGMGEVWKASHRLLAREAAIKFIKPSTILGLGPAESEQALKRFEREAQVTASLSSAHTIDLHDFGIAADGTFYYVMELLDGLDLDQFVRRYGALPPGRVVHLLVQVCESLEEAHAKGLIHRDVKPANIYVCRSGMRRDFVKVLDFGLVAHHRAETSADLRLTQPELVLGTPAYMAPEAALGQPLDGRSDLYGLGCVAFWLLTGREVFEGRSIVEVVAKHVKDAPEPPSRHAPNAVAPEVDALVLRCLAKEPERRPASAGELARLLRAIPLADAWSEERAAVWWSEHVTGSRVVDAPDLSAALEPRSAPVVPSGRR